MKLRKLTWKQTGYFVKNIAKPINLKKIFKDFAEKTGELNKLQREEVLYLTKLDEGKFKPSMEDMQKQDERVEKINELGQELIFDIVNTIVDNYETIEIHINTFFGELAGMTPQEFENLSFDEATDIISEFVKEQGAGFFKKVSL